VSDLSYSSLLRNLSADHYYRRITREEYRSQRRQILDRIDEEFNGRKPLVADDEDQASEQADQSIFMKTIAFFKNKDLDD
jgi:hypothetical protein